VSCRYFDFAGILPWLVINRLIGSTSVSPALVKLYDRAVVPLARRTEAMISPPVGKNLVAIVRRPAQRET
jgi:hypothetical protein